MRQHEARETIGQRRLADAGRPADQPGMRHAPALVARQQRLLGFGVAEQRRGLARQPDVLLARAHGAALSAALSVGRARSGCRRSETCFQMRSATTSRGGRPSIMHDAARLLMRQRAIGAAQFLVKLDRLGFEAVGGAARAPARGARQADGCRHVEHEGQVRHGGADGDALEPADQLSVDLAERALIDAGGIDEAVADHPFAVDQRRPDHVAHVIVARGREQDGLGLHAERLGGARQDDMADDLGARRAARLAREHDLDAERLQVRRRAAWRGWTCRCRRRPRK